MTEITLPDIAARVKAGIAARIKPSPCHSNWASEAGHECERYLYYHRTAWDKAIPHDVALEFIFSGGRKIEDMAIRELEDEGYHVVERARAYEWPELEISGRIDCKIRFNGDLIPVEVKGYNHRDYTKLNTIQDFLTSPKPWVRRTPAQILLYMWMANVSWGGIYLKSKSTYEPKIIWSYLHDYDEYMEGVLQKLTRVNRAVRKNDPPVRIDYDEKVCLDCAFFHLCKPDVSMGEGVWIYTDPELEAALERREELKPLSKEYEEVDSYVKERVSGISKAIIGGYIISGREITGERKPTTGGPYSYWRSDIRRIVNTD